MVPDDCASVEFLLQADLDGELDISGAATLAAHLVDCPTCQAQQEAVSRLSARLRSELPYYAAPARLREAIQSSAEKADLPAVAGLAASSRSREAQPPRWFGVVGEWFRLAFPVGGAAALLAALALIVIVPRGSDTTDGVIASHIRALQPGHLMDVISTRREKLRREPSSGCHDFVVILSQDCDLLRDYESRLQSREEILNEVLMYELESRRYASKKVESAQHLVETGSAE
jgi:anti-sigma factor RsiW